MLKVLPTVLYACFVVIPAFLLILHQSRSVVRPSVMFLVNVSSSRTWQLHTLSVHVSHDVEGTEQRLV